MVIGDDPVEGDKFADEKLSPVLTLWKYQGIRRCDRIP